MSVPTTFPTATGGVEGHPNRVEALARDRRTRSLTLVGTLGLALACGALTACSPAHPTPTPSPSARSFDVASGDARYAPQLDGLATLYGTTEHISYGPATRGFRSVGGRCLRTITSAGTYKGGPTSYTGPALASATPGNAFRSPGVLRHYGATQTDTYNDPDGAEFVHYIDGPQETLTISYVVTRAADESCG